MSNAWRLRLLVSLALMGGAAPGCGGDDGAECGTGTVEVDGECLPAETACGMGTVYDATARTCVTAIECAEGTMLMGTECVPDGSAFCGGNTIFDTETGTCVPDPDALCEGDLVFVMETATCVDPDELLEGMADVQELAEPNDPSFNETAMAQPVDIADGSGSFYGCVEPMDFDDDGVIDPDRDFFAIEVDGPTLLRVRTDGIRGANAAVAFLSGDSEGALTEFGWQRFVLSLASDGADQKVFLPAAGTYLVVATDARSLLLGEPAGGEDQCYFTQLEVEELPTPTVITPGTPLEGDFDEPRFFAFDATRGQLVLHSATEQDASGAATDRGSIESTMVTLVDSTFRSAAADTQDGFFGPIADGVVEDFALGLDADQTVWIVVDSLYDLSLDSTRFSVAVQDANAVEIPEDGTVDFTHDDELPAFGFFEATAGDVVRLQFDQPDGDTLEVGVLQPNASGFGVSGSDVYVQIEQTGIHYLQIVNDDGVDGESYGVEFERASITPTAMTLGTAASGALAEHDRAFFSVDLSTADWIQWSASNLTNVTDLELTFYERGPFGVLGASVPEIDGDELDATSVFERILRGEGSNVLVSVTSADAVTGDETFDVLVDDVPYVDLGSIVPGTDITRTGETATGGEYQRYLLEAVAFSPLTIGTTTTTPTLDAVISVVDASFATVRDFDVGAAGEAEGGTYVMANDWVAFVVFDLAEVGGSYDLTVSAEAPPYTPATGALGFTSVCPSEGGAGANHGVTATDIWPALDDGLSTTPLAIPGDFPFTFFGAGVSQATISTNGWLTFTPSFAGDSFLESSTFDVIAPLSGDLDLDALCTHRDGSTLTIEWRGQSYEDGGVVEMQVVLHQTGRIDFIYGPDHQSLDGTVGLINDDGSVRYSIDTLLAFPSSVTFTPAP